MDKTYRYIIEGVEQGNISKKTAAELIRMIRNEENKTKEDIAVVGIGLDLPNARTVDEFWNNLCEGIDLVSEFPEGRKKDIKDYIQYSKSFDSDVKFLQGAFLDEIDKFDYNYFKLTPKEASLMDPCQRLFLQTAIKAIEDSGHDVDSFRGTNTGVYVGFANTIKDSYQKMIYDVEPESISSSIASNLPAIIPSRISYLLNLDGPSLVVDTACSSSLVAIHLASKAILNGECSQAIVGSVKIHLVPVDVEYTKMGIESSDGLTRTFDDNSDGAGIGEGSIAVILKTVTKAMEDNDQIYAVIKGSAVNQDGSSAGITAPNPIAQAKVITKAWKDARINPEDLMYIEAHGTGTKLGDPIEIEGLKKAFGQFTKKKQFCAIGSIKSNIGHLYECSGLANFIKVALSLRYKKLVKSINFQVPNIKCNFIDSPLYVNTRTQDLSNSKKTLLCGINSFGFSGTNCHIVLQEPKQNIENVKKIEKDSYIFCISAVSNWSLNEMYKEYVQFLMDNQDIDLYQFCYTVNISRSYHNIRTAIVFRTKEELIQKLMLKTVDNNYVDNYVFTGSYKVVSTSYMDVALQNISQEYKEQLTRKVNDLLERQSENSDLELLQETGKLYVQGADIAFEKMFSDKPVYRVKLPIYPFEKKRLWLKIPELSNIREQMFYKFDWIEDNKDLQNVNPVNLKNQQMLLVYNSSNETAKELTEELKLESTQIIEVVMGNKFAALDDKKFMIRDDQEDYELLFDVLELDEDFRIIYMVEELLSDNKLVARLLNVMRLLKACEACKKLNYSLDFVLKNVNNVFGNEQISFENAMLFGYGLGIQKEYSNINCRKIDIDNQTSAGQIVDELNQAFRKEYIALRNGKRYVRCLMSSVHDNSKEERKIEEDGVYLVTGGVGDIALELAKDISSKNNVKLILCSHSEFPKSIEWPQILKAGDNHRNISRIRKIQEIIDNGSDVEIMKCDLGCENDVKETVSYVIEKYNKINGIIHAAGIEENSLIQDETDDKVIEILQPKVLGMYYLDKYTKMQQLDFFIAFSTIATVFPAPAQAGYIAANAFMEAFAKWRTLNGRDTNIICWSTWAETGMAYRNKMNYDTAFKTLSTKDGINGFYHVLSNNLPYTLVGKINDDSRFANVWNRVSFEISKEINYALERKSGDRKSVQQNMNINTKAINTVLLGRQDGVYTDREKKIASIIGRMLGFEELYVYDSLFELGVDSILLVKLAKELEKAFDVQIPISRFMENSTVEKISAMLEECDDRIMENNRVVINNDEKYDSFDLTKVQYSYYLGRNPKYEMGNISTHAYVEIETEYDINKLNIALNKTIQQHDMLRAVMLENGMQQILPDVDEYNIKCYELSDEEAFNICLLRERERMSHQIFDILKWPLFEFNAVKLKDKKTLLLISFDMLIADAVSIQIILRDVMDFYVNEDKPIRKFEYSFRDYVFAYKNVRNLDSYKKDKEFWEERLEDFPSAPAVQLKCDPMVIDKPHFVRKEMRLSKSIWTKLKQRAAKSGVTPSAMVCTAYSEVLGFWSNQERFALNLAVFNRHPFHTDVEDMVGDFTTVLLLDVDMRDTASFVERSKKIQKNLMSALEHKNYEGIDFLGEYSRIHDLNNRAAMPFVFTSMIYNDADDSFNLLGNKTYGISQTSQIYLDCQVSDAGGILSIVWDYVEQIFDARIIQHMFDQFVKILKSCGTENEDISNAGISKYDEEIIIKYNQTEENIEQTTLPGIFKKSVNQYAKNKAIIDGEKFITYEELDRESNRVANYLFEKGIGAHDFVGVEARRGIASLIHVIGVLKSGAAYIPIDPTYGESRKQYILENAKSQILLAADWIETEGKEYSSDFEVTNDAPDNEAYVIYTSGSTGKPKGVVISNKAVCNTILDINNKIELNEQDCLAGLSSMCFDLSVYDIFGTFSTGAALVIIEEIRDVPEVIKRIEDNQVSVWNSVPSIVAMTIDGMDEEYKNYSVRYILMSGDWIPLNLPKKIKNKFPGAKMMSLGGATEASIWSIYYPFSEVKNEWKSIPYGKPLANQTMYILNFAMELCPLGVMGEIYIGGIGVAECYQNNEEQTNAAFITHPTLGRIYKTGDYGRLIETEDETYIEFMGRKDNQVKVRGFRVELGEIEKCMNSIEAIKDSVVVDYSDNNGNKILYGYYISDEEQDVQALKNHMLKELPEYMIPLKFIKIDEIPLTSNGKVDKKRLVQPQFVIEKKKYVAAGNELEEKLVNIFEEELKVQPIGIEDDFFSLGINSILMVSIINRIGKELNISIKFKDIMDKNCIKDLVELIMVDSNKQKNNDIYFKAASDIENEFTPFPMTEIQNSYMIGREGIFELGNISTHGYMEYVTLMDIERMNIALNKVIKRHGMLRCVFNEDGTQRILSDCPEYVIDIEDLTGVEQSEQMKRIVEIREQMSHFVFNPQTWPLFEIRALRLDEKKKTIFIGYDLLIADGASMQIINKEILEYYRNPELVLPSLEFTFRDYMIAYRKFKEESEVYKEDKEYWLNQLEEFPMAPALPLRVEASQIENVRFKRKQKIFTKSEWNKLREKAKEAGITSSALVCAAYCDVLGFWSNQPQFALNLTVFNRYPFHEDVNKIVGEFTSVVLVDVDLTKGNDFISRAKELQGRLFEALEHRHYEGVEFIREISKYHNMGTGAVMPIVFTSMIFEEMFDLELNEDETRVQQLGISQTSQVYVDCQVSDAGGELSIIIDYVEDLFKAQIIDQLFNQFISILENLINPVNDFELAISSQERQLIEIYNNTNKKIDHSTLHSLFTEQAKKNPNNIALMYGNDSMTYEVVDKRSNQVARHLEEQGVERGDFVAVEAQRQMNTIVNILGILKACAAYVPVDPMYPEERRKYIIENSQAKVFVESDIYQNKSLDKYDDSAIEDNFYPEDVAYIIYTSGSTGRPKGVVITHKAACNTILDINEQYGVTSEDRFIGISSMCFDLSVYDIFGAFQAGASLVMIPDQRDVKHLLEEVENKGVTIWNSVPSIMNIAIETATEDDNSEKYLWNEEVQWHEAEVLEVNNNFEKLYWSPVKHWRTEKEKIIIGESIIHNFAIDAFVQIYNLTQEGILYQELVETIDINKYPETENIIARLIEEKILVYTILEPHEIFKNLNKMFTSKYTDEIIYVSEKNKQYKLEQLSREVLHKGSTEIELLPDVQLPNTIIKRRSERIFDEEHQITYEEFSKMFTVFKQTRNGKNISYYYASAGGLYPVDIYIYVKKGRVENIGKGLYYYNPLKNQIELLNEAAIIDDKAYYFANKSIFNSSAFSVYMIYNANVTMPKYDSLGYLYAAIDTGIMVGTFTQIAENENIGLCSIGDMNFKVIKNEFGLDKNQVWLHTMEVGRRLE